MGEEERAVCVCICARVEDYKPKVAEESNRWSRHEWMADDEEQMSQGGMGRIRWKDA